MECALIVSASEKSVAFFRELLSAASIGSITAVGTGGEARRLLVDRAFDLVVINAPLVDESGESLACRVAQRGSQVILVVRGEHFEEISAHTEECGVLTVPRPLNRALFWSALKLAKAADARLLRMRAENSRLLQKIEDIRAIDRAKCVLIARLNMSEPDAHRYIEKQAMNQRATKRAVAEEILNIYEN